MEEKKEGSHNIVSEDTANKWKGCKLTNITRYSFNINNFVFADMMDLTTDPVMDSVWHKGHSPDVASTDKSITVD